MKKNIYDQKMYVNILKSQPEHSTTGINQVNSILSEHREGIGDIKDQVLNKQNHLINKTSVIVESQLTHKKKILNDKLNSSDLNTLLIQLSKILEAGSTSIEKDLTPFWTQQSKEISEKLWLPQKIDCVDSVLISSQESSKNTPKAQSWFSINKKYPKMKNSSMTSFQLSQYSLPDSMVSEVTKSKKKLKKLKTLKIRIFPTEKEKEKLLLMMKQSRWYYNSILNCFLDKVEYKQDNILSENEYSYFTIRNLLTEYKFIEERFSFDDPTKMLCFTHFEKNNDRKAFYPSWLKNQVHSRLPRGCAKKLSQNINSVITNYKNGNINKFNLKFRSMKKDLDFVLFEDKNYPAFLKDIHSKYWFREKTRRYMSFKDILKQQNASSHKGLELIYDKVKDRFMIHYPVDYDWFP